ncbi:class I SAM-dependent methyltransferase [Treponema socranskii]|uniref:class I SAM-dependent methyltransferase n=1 Tax=Treponema socranskii TaxID=53419 RepID=UPI003D6F9D3E
MDKDLRQNEWNDSYRGGGNVLFYPHEEIIRFVNKYVRKRTSYNSFRNVMKLSDDDWKNFRSLDLGCGCGRHVNFMDEFGLNPYGIDLSDMAIALGKEWFFHIGKRNLCDRLIVGNVADLPFQDDFFNICVSHGVLDSMPRDIAIKGIQETLRCMKTGGMIYLDLIMNMTSSDKEEVQVDGLERDTIQSYFTLRSIKDFIPSTTEIVDFKIVNWCNNNGVSFNKRAHLIIRKI